MATQRYISTSFWDDEWVQELDPSEKLFYIYLLTNPLTTIAGVYKITDRRVSFDCGFSKEVVLEMWSRFTRNNKAVRFGEWVIIPAWPKHQRYESRPQIRKGIDNIIASLPKDVLDHMVSIGYEYPIIPYQYPPSYIDSDSDTDTDIDTEVQSTRADSKHNGRPVNTATLTALIAEYGQGTVDDYLQRISDYCNANGKRYKDHAATCRNWLKRDNVPKRAEPKESGITDFMAELVSREYGD